MYVFHASTPAASSERRVCAPQRYAQSGVVKRTLFELIAAELLASMLEDTTPEASAHGGAKSPGSPPSPMCAPRGCGLEFSLDISSSSLISGMLKEGKLCD